MLKENTAYKHLGEKIVYLGIDKSDSIKNLTFLMKSENTDVEGFAKIFIPEKNVALENNEIKIIEKCRIITMYTHNTGRDFIEFIGLKNIYNQSLEATN
jgi:hypothetical protein